MTEKFLVPAAEIDDRIRRVQARLLEMEIPALLVVQRVDLFYFSGTAQSGFFFIPAEGAPLLMIKRYMPRALQETPLQNVVEIRSIRDVPKLIEEFHGRLPEKMGFELDVMPVKEFDFFRRLFSGRDCVDGSAAVLDVRMIKSPWEILQMERVAELSCRTFEYIAHNLRPGYTEMEFAALFEGFARGLGHGGKLRVRDYQTEGYPWHILSGRSGGMPGVLDSPSSGEGTSAAFPCGAGYKKLEANEPIMIDFNCVLNGYHFDETRMFAIGSIPAKALDASRAAIEIQNRVLEAVRPGIPVNDLFRMSVEKAESMGYADSYLGPPEYKVSFIGHGIGTELIEKPIISRKNNTILRPGMTFALEPKLVFENEFAAGIESVFLVTDTGHRMISRVPVRVFIC